MTNVTSVAERSQAVPDHRIAPPRRTHGLVVTGSLRADSFTRAFGEALVLEQPWLRLGPSLDRLPFYDADSDALGTPGTVLDLRARVRTSALLVIVTPDYDGAVPGLVANAVDWLSHSAVLRGTRFMVVSAGPDDQGGTTAGAALASRLERAGGLALAPHVAVPHVDLVLKNGQSCEALANLAGRTRSAARADARAATRSASLRRAA